MNENKAYDPAKELGDKLYKSPRMFPDDGVAGDEKLVNQNEKAMLENNMAKIMDKSKGALVKESGHRRGIYTDNGA